MELTDFTLVIVLVSGLLYLYNKYKFDFWKKRNVYYEEPNFFFGHIKGSITGKEHLMYTMSRMYDNAKRKRLRYFGIYTFWKPVLVVFDLELIKCIVQKDFSHFMNHRGEDNERDPLTKHLFNLSGSSWKNMRVKLTPAFTSGKLKLMFQTIVECSKGLKDVLAESAKNSEPLELKDVLARYTTDIVGSVGFGIEINSLKHPDSEFRKRGNESFEQSTRQKLLIMLLGIFPNYLINWFNVKRHSDTLINFFTTLVKDTVKYREENNVFRKDFMHLLIQLKNFGKVTEENEGHLMDKNKQSANEITIDEMVAQAYVFFIAGFETSSTTMTFTLLELALNQDVQEKARNEIRTVLQKYNNQITYEAINDMEYLEQVIQEALRKHPPANILPRVCSKDYKVPDSDLVIKAGQSINIPVYSLHRDPEYFPDPEKFDPDRFSPENRGNIPPFAYLPFGEGPRICIGLRFAKYQTKVGICSILQNYRLTVNKKTHLPITYDASFITSTRGGVYLDLELIK